MNRRFIAEAWRKFRDGVPPAGSAPEDRRVAFFAGAAIMFAGVFANLGQDGTLEPNDSDVAWLDGVDEELADFEQELETTGAMEGQYQ
jgi:hypothetical protein